LPLKPEALKFIVYYRENGLGAAEAIASQGYVNPDPSAQSGATVREVWALWLDRIDKLAARTKAHYRYIGKLFKEKYGAHALSSITHHDIDQWLNAVGGSECHQYNCFRIVRRFFEHCRDWLEIIPRNPAAKIGIEKPEGKKGILTPAEMKLVLEKAEEINSPPLLAWAALGGYCGLRTSEILRATWEDFDWKGKELHVIPKKTRGGLRERYIELLPTADAILRHWPGKGRSGRGTTRTSGFIESFNGQLRDECLNTHLFASLEEARDKLQLCHEEYNDYRPHGALPNLPQAAFAAQTLRTLGKTNGNRKTQGLLPATN